jgi:hypothetical protein
VQAVRVAATTAANEATNQYRVAAFVGWQNAAAQGALKPGTTFEKYQKQIGLTAPTSSRPKSAVPSATIAVERDAAHARAASVREAFKRE